MYALTKDRYLNIIYSVGILYPGCSISVFQLSVQGKWKKDSPPPSPASSVPGSTIELIVL